MRKVAIVLGVALLVFAGLNLLSALLSVTQGQFRIGEFLTVAIPAIPGYILFNWGRV